MCTGASVYLLIYLYQIGKIDKKFSQKIVKSAEQEYVLEIKEATFFPNFPKDLRIKSHGIYSYSRVESSLIP
jgi:hypothetical protein